jgi:hypothetical protein
MKKKLACFAVIIIFSKQLFAQQQDTVHLKKTVDQTIIVTDRAPQAVFAELWGRALFFSANYDRRFSKRLDGFGFTVGGGYIGIDGLNLFSVPVTLNYLLGNNGKYLELGAGLTYFNGSIDGEGLFSDDNSSSSSSTSSAVMGTLTIGYRSQPVNGGFLFRAGVNPIIYQHNFIPYFPYVGLGYSF